MTLYIRLVSTGLLIILAIWLRGALPEPQSLGRNAAPANAEISVNGAGSTSIYPILSKLLDEYCRQHPGIRINYQAIGSTAGIHGLLNGTIVFAATDVPMSDEQLAKANGRILHVPLTVHAIVPAYNLAQVPELRLSGSTLAGIFMGKITRWNAPAIANDNLGIDLPALDIKVMHSFPSSRGSPETYVMTDYLSKVSPEFNATLKATEGGWPVASNRYLGAEGTAGFVRKTPGAIGYVWQSPFHGSEQYGIVKNADGEFVAATPDSLSSASALAVPLIQAKAPDFRVSITNAPGKMSYPIASFIWLVLCVDRDHRKENEVMASFLNWALTDGQKLAAKLGYPPLASDLVKLELQHLGADQEY